jgi:hypothetical protein
MKSNLFLCALLALVIPTAIFAEPAPAAKYSALKNTVILVIRHAEKPDDGLGLTADGEARARAYADYFKNLAVDGQPLKPDYLFAAADSQGSHRPRLTLEPTSHALGLAIDTRFKSKDVQEIADEVHSKPHGHTILIAWHHGQIPNLLHALGADTRQLVPNDKWPEHVFGWLIVLRYDAEGRLIEAKRINEKLMPDDLKTTAAATP